ncbi:hypothetical protein ACFO5R_22295 [Halosolutus amylolyticus]|uniref:Uncharacterized protein n=1 Tax=Halosolutus amylolyticus TaxID=2932267 RepID=A0ABD5PW04_9EURY|nr:hypothetical protein [Halosolutus amylolyticus]
MWPTELYSSSGGTVLESVALLGVEGGAIEAIQSLPALMRAVAGVVATLLVSIMILGMLQGYGSRAVATCRRSPVISVCIGLPSTLVVGLLTGVGYLMLGTSVGAFFGVPLVVLGATVLPAVTAIGLVSVGRSIAARVGRNELWAGILVGSLFGGLAAITVPVAIVVGSIAAAFGMGASVRVLVGSRGATTPDERTVPPANQI